MSPEAKLRFRKLQASLKSKSQDTFWEILDVVASSNRTEFSEKALPLIRDRNIRELPDYADYLVAQKYATAPLHYGANRSPHWFESTHTLRTRSIFVPKMRHSQLSSKRSRSAP
jgi:hypothetical protein